MLQPDPLRDLYLGHLTQRLDKLEQDEDRTLVHYTSSDVLFSILEHKFIWMRNARHMNDFREMEHGLDAIQEFFNDESAKLSFTSAMNDIHPGSYEDLARLLDDFSLAMIFSTYITCLSEHNYKRDEGGKLSMWRGYGTDGVAVAVVLKKENMIGTSPYGLEGYPVEYIPSQALVKRLHYKVRRLKENKDRYAGSSKQDFVLALFKMFQLMICATKHPGFKEEREWRLLYSPNLWPSASLEDNRKYISAGGLPQLIYRIPVDGRAIGTMKAITVPELVDRIIVGPCSGVGPIMDAIHGALRMMGQIEKPIVSHCGIPFRTKY